MYNPRMSSPTVVERIGMVARWKPVHLGHLPVLKALCNRADLALIGIGSSNVVDLRNPFTLTETEAMLHLVLDDRKNYNLIPIPDLHDGPRWREMVVELFGQLDYFVTANPYVVSLLRNDYQIIHPSTLVAKEEQTPIDGTLVRREMAHGDGWRDLVPNVIERYIINNQLDTRFRREFGLQTLALETIIVDEKEK